MKRFYYIVFILFISTCTNPTQESVVIEPSTTSSTSTSTSTSSTTTTTLNSLIVSNYEEIPNGLVRIEVKSTKAELNEKFEIEIFEYEGSGSGFFISNDGYIVTNNHVVSGAVTIEIYTQYRTQPYAAQLIGVSECDDLAILKIQVEDVQYFSLSTKEPKLGEEILAAGFPLGDKEVTFLNGIVSKKQTNGSTTWASIDYAFEHTAEILPGSSGGPIVNSQAEVIGIAYAGNEDRQEFGIPIVSVADKIDLIISQNFEYSFNANVEQFYGVGLYIYSVDSNSPFRNVGIKGGEVITSIRGLSIVDESTLKMYCDSLFTRNTDIGIIFSGISLNDLEEFEVEVSLDGSISNEIKRSSLIKNSTPNQSKSSTTTTTTIVPTSNSSAYNFNIPDLIKVETNYLSEYLWEIKIYLKDVVNSDGSYYGIQNTTHCIINFLAPPYFDSDTNPFTKFGKVKRNETCSSQRLNNNEIIITYELDVSSTAFSWSKLGSNEIPISSISLYPTYLLNDEKTYTFSITWNFGSGRDCGGSEQWDSDGKNYSPDCAYQISGDKTWLGNSSPESHRRSIRNSPPYNWIVGNNYGNQYGSLDISSIETNNTCSKKYKGYQSKRWWWLDNNLICVKKK